MTPDYDSTMRLHGAFTKVAVSKRDPTESDVALQHHGDVLESHEDTLAVLVKTQIEHGRRLEALDAAITGLREELNELDNRAERYAFLILIVIGLLAWVT